MDEDGTIRVGGTRMTLDLILAEHHAGASPEQIAADYDVLLLGDVYATIGYYLHHRAEIDTYLEQRRRDAWRSFAAKIEDKHPREGRRDSHCWHDVARRSDRMAAMILGLSVGRRDRKSPLDSDSARPL